MKKILLLCAVFMAAPTVARAETCPGGQYWNSIDKKCVVIRFSDGKTGNIPDCLSDGSGSF